MTLEGGERQLLAATALRSTWDANAAGAKGLVLLARWADPRHEADAAVAIVPNPWRDPEELARAHSYLAELHEIALSALDARLGAYHGDGWGPHHARLLLGPWLLAYVPSAYDRWCRLQAATERSHALVAYGPGMEATTPPADTLDAVQLLKTDEYNLQLMSRMFDVMRIERLSIEAHVHAQQFPLLQPSLKRRVADASIRALLSVRASRSVVLKSAHFSESALTALARKTGLHALPAPSSPVCARTASDVHSRERTTAVALGSTAFERWLSNWLMRDLPTCFLEGFGDLRLAASAFGPPPRAILSANAWHYDEPFKLWAARASDHGTLLLAGQHGGNYGVEAWHSSELHERTVTQGYYTWGWTEGPGTKPMPAAKMTGVTVARRAPAERDILFATTVWQRFPVQLEYGPERFDAYLERQCRFVAALAPEVRGRVRARVHRESSDWAVAERLLAEASDLRIEGWDEPFLESLSRSSLFVCDHLSTTFAEAIGLGWPTLLFWHPDFYDMRPRARAAFDELRAVGVLLDTPEAAAHTVGDVVADPLGWWNEPSRRGAIDNVAGQFALSRASAPDDWAAELRRVALGGRA